MKWIFVFIAFLAVHGSAQARLGGAAENVDTGTASAKKVRLSVSQKKSSDYTVQTLTQDGLTVKEYVNSDGVVFAVSWRGAIKPDLSQYLGDYYSEYQSAVKNQSERGRSSSTLKRQTQRAQTSNLSIRREGHMRDWKGVTYVPNLVPSNFNMDGIE